MHIETITNTLKLFDMYPHFFVTVLYKEKKNEEPDTSEIQLEL